MTGEGLSKGSARPPTSPRLSHLLRLCTPSTAVLTCIHWANDRTSLYPHTPVVAPLHLAAFHTDIGATIAHVHYVALHGMITQLCTDWLLFVTGVSNAEMGNTACELRALAGRCSTGRSGTSTTCLNGTITRVNLDLGLYTSILHCLVNCVPLCCTSNYSAYKRRVNRADKGNLLPTAPPSPLCAFYVALALLCSL
ncbi:hypothetical protein DFH07DRAFT_958027 [Mycena maculata]|uniref:Uncharacterized protein n=1 Tax=Mycena maculata TaxID=230809 RepID=A0AAD7NF35_9AGAR|nr:hypothetical protein DFH07DRAFT_958027 [Mycena maculata]